MVFLSSARVVLDQADISRAVRRISHEIVENSRGSDDLIILGIPTRGVPLARRIAETVAQIEGHPVPCGAIDVTLYRDDLRLREVRALEPTDIPSQGIDGCTVVLVDDVLYSGTIAAAMEFVVRLQGPQGEIYWCEDTTLGIREDSLITGCSSIYKSFECALNIATILREEVPHWAMARTRLGNAIANHPECFDRTWDSKSRFAMDWFYPVLTNVIRGKEAQRHLARRWKEFVIQDLGCVCVNDEPWVTVAESCELVMALLSAGQYQQAVQLFSWLHQFRDNTGAYWTGYVYRDNQLWPEEKPTWTAGAVLLAADALSNRTGASHLFRNETSEAEIEIGWEGTTD